jgi:putative PEP-CTERM system TPR-repeat lipoprotein
LLGKVHLLLGEVDLALGVLDPAVVQAPNDPGVLAVAAEAYMRKGLHVTASELLERALELTGGSSKLRTQLAMSHLGAGRQEDAIEELRVAFSGDEAYRQAGFALALLHIKRGAYAEAELVARKLLESDSQNLTVMNVLASAQLGSGRRDDARATLEQALVLDPKFLPARINLGKLERMEGRASEARARFTAILADRPEDVETMVELSVLDEMSGQREDARRWLEKARAVDPKAKRPALRLVDLNLAAGAPERALVIAGELAVDSEDLDVLAALARSHLANGNRDVASTIYNRMARFAGFDPRELYRVAHLQSGIGAHEESLHTLDKALSGAPDFLPALVARVEVLLALGKVEAARSRANELLEGHPDRADAYRLDGEVALRERRCDEAIAGFGRAVARRGTSSLVIRQAQANLECERLPQARELLVAWVGEHPRDLAARKALTEVLLRAGDRDAAVREYEVVLQASPRDPGVLNNLAYLYADRGDPRALELGQRAYEANPDSASANDTLGWILVRGGDPTRGIAYLREARSRDFRNPEIRYHLGVALEALGRVDEARRELDAALGVGAEFGGAEAARVLRSKLGG